jgi:hypothetical protein
MLKQCESLLIIRLTTTSKSIIGDTTFAPQALVSFKKCMPPPLPYFKVNICPFPLPRFASIFFSYL